ncbi:MAG: NfeD family protein [Eubacteriales bacterium]|nr:NfeD family protein [Eubacteriales bacterium]
MEVLTVIGFVLLVIGIILMGIEMVIPGFGIPGISGIISIVIGVLLAAKSLKEGLTIITVVVVILAIMMTVTIVFFHSGRVKSPISLEEALDAGPGYLNSSDLQYLVGKEGMSITVLRPTGKCDVDGVSFEVRSENGYIEKSKKIKIVKVQGNTLIVREC